MSKRSRKRSQPLFEKTSQPKAATTDETVDSSQASSQLINLSESQNDDKSSARDAKHSTEEQKAVAEDSLVDKPDPITIIDPAVSKDTKPTDVTDEKQQMDQSPPKSTVKTTEELPVTQPMTDELSGPPTDQQVDKPVEQASDSSKAQSIEQPKDGANDQANTQSSEQPGQQPDHQPDNESLDQPGQQHEFSQYINPFMITVNRVRRCAEIDEAYVSKLTEIDDLIMKPLADQAMTYLNEKDQQKKELEEQNTTLDAKLHEFVTFLQQMRSFVAPTR